LVIQAGSNDLFSVAFIDSIKVANDLIELSKRLCISSGAKGAIIGHITKRGVGRYLPSTAQAERFNEKVNMANIFMKEVTGAGLEPHVISWQHKGMSEWMDHLLCSDGTHVNAHGQDLFYTSMRGAVIRAAREAGFARP
jgi:lysophospholipase L1-like esterase